MNKKKVIRVFEFDEIKQDQEYDGFVFEEKELIAIQKYNSANKNKYFTLTHKGVKFKNYVKGSHKNKFGKKSNFLGNFSLFFKLLICGFQFKVVLYITFAIIK